MELYEACITFPVPLVGVVISQEEVQLFTDSRDRKKWDKLSEFFAIIVTTEHLENARISSAVGRDEVNKTIY